MHENKCYSVRADGVETPAAHAYNGRTGGGAEDGRMETAMNLESLRRPLVSAVLVVTCMSSTLLWAGGAGFGDDDDNSAEEGPSYFGFVKDINGATVPDAKVTVGIKNRGGVVTRTDALGAYKVPGFGKDVDPQEVEVACDKPGYKQLKALRRMRASNADPKIPVETECTLQRI